MEVNIIKASVHKRKIALSDYMRPTAGNRLHDMLEVTLDSEWDGLDKRVTFYRDGECKHDAMEFTLAWDGESAIEIPWEVTQSVGSFGFTVTGSENGEDRLVTVAMAPSERIRVNRNGEDEGIAPSAPTEDVIKRIDNVAADLEAKVASGYFKGAKGDTGATGQPGRDGISPTATVSKSGKVSTITITDKNGTTTAQVMDGERGERGERGLQGERGVQGERGLTGERGLQGVQGVPGVPGAKGDPGDSGVYVGDGEPPATANVWIDPNGNPSTGGGSGAGVYWIDLHFDENHGYFIPDQTPEELFEASQDGVVFWAKAINGDAVSNVPALVIASNNANNDDGGWEYTAYVGLGTTYMHVLDLNGNQTGDIIDWSLAE